MQSRFSARYIGLLFLLIISARAGFAQEDCSLRKDSEGVKVYLCENPESSFKTIIVELDVPATLSQYAAVVLNVENYINWQYKVANQKILEQVSKTELVYYSEVETPWPASNRDYIFHLLMEQDPNSLVINLFLSAEPEYLPENKGIVRIPFAKSHLTVTPLDAGNVRVRYELDINPGGEVPAWIINMFAANAPWQTYVNFRDQVINQGDTRIEVDFIKNFDK